MVVDHRNPILDSLDWRLGCTSGKAQAIFGSSSFQEHSPLGILTESLGIYWGFSLWQVHNSTLYLVRLPKTSAPLFKGFPMRFLASHSVKPQDLAQIPTG